MITLNGQHITEACLVAATLAALPWARSTATGYYIVFALDGSTCTYYRPTTDNDSALSDFRRRSGLTGPGYAYGYVDNAEPGVRLVFNGIGLNCPLVNPDDPEPTEAYAERLVKYWRHAFEAQAARRDR